MFRFQRVLFAIIGMVVVALMASYPFLQKIEEAERRAEVKINNQVLSVEVVNTKKGFRKGLSGRDSLSLSKGMFFVFDKKKEREVWMKGMNFPIDVIWISGSQVVGVDKNLKPESEVGRENLKIYNSPEPVDKILEVRAGRAKLLRVSAGDEVKVKPLLPGSESIQ